MIDLSSATNLKILGYFFMNDLHIFPSELAGILDMDKSNLRKKLVLFERKGVLISYYRGKERYYYLNKNHPLYEPYLKIIQGSYGVERIIKEKFSGKKKIDIYLYGSAVNGEFDAQSDIDILIVSKEHRVSFIPIIKQIEAMLDREVSFTLLSPDEFEEKNNNDPFIKGIFQEGARKIQ